VIDDNRNLNLNGDTMISAENSDVSVHVIPTNEELVIAIDAAKIAIASKQTPWA
jgi:acetate kinase